MPNILILEASKPAKSLSGRLEAEGHSIQTISSLNGVPSISELSSCDLAILVLEEDSKWLDSFLSTFRQSKLFTPLLIARNANCHFIDENVLKNGADSIIDIDSPENLMLSRINSLLKRTFINSKKLYYLEDGVFVDSETHCVHKQDELVCLSIQQFKIFEFLANHAGTYFTSIQLLERIGHSSEVASESSMRMHIMKLRKSLKQEGQNSVVVTKYGAGYCISHVRTDRGL